MLTAFFSRFTLERLVSRMVTAHMAANLKKLYKNCVTHSYTVCTVQSNQLQFHFKTSHEFKQVLQISRSPHLTLLNNSKQLKVSINMHTGDLRPALVCFLFVWTDFSLPSWNLPWHYCQDFTASFFPPPYSYLLSLIFIIWWLRQKLSSKLIACVFVHNNCPMENLLINHSNFCSFCSAFSNTCCCVLLCYMARWHGIAAVQFCHQCFSLTYWVAYIYFKQLFLFFSLLKDQPNYTRKKCFRNVLQNE